MAWEQNQGKQVSNTGKIFTPPPTAGQLRLRRGNISAAEWERRKVQQRPNYVVYGRLPGQELRVLIPRGQQPADPEAERTERERQRRVKAAERGLLRTQGFDPDAAEWPQDLNRTTRRKKVRGTYLQLLALRKAAAAPDRLRPLAVPEDRGGLAEPLDIGAGEERSGLPVSLRSALLGHDLDSCEWESRALGSVDTAALRTVVPGDPLEQHRKGAERPVFPAPEKARGKHVPPLIKRKQHEDVAKFLTQLRGTVRKRADPQRLDWAKPPPLEAGSAAYSIPRNAHRERRRARQRV